MAIVQVENMFYFVLCTLFITSCLQLLEIANAKPLPTDELTPQHSSRRQAPNVLVVSVSQSNPLHVISAHPPQVTASHTLSKLIS